MPEIKITEAKGRPADHAFDVELAGYKYKVSFTDEYYKKLTGGKFTPEKLVKKSFDFLLEREGPESILREFDLSIIGVYFPEYEEEIIQGL
ncbi:MAG TPA: hypothetical protein VFX86_01385 [Candidatus Saccharimonadales bacterium]|nr:hypothetical protein [Candidatus Saccharimonadales bacterium]